MQYSTRASAPHGLQSKSLVLKPVKVAVLRLQPKAPNKDRAWGASGVHTRSTWRRMLSGMSSAVQPAKCGKRLSTAAGTAADLPACTATCSGMWCRSRCGLWQATPSPAPHTLGLLHTLACAGVTCVTLSNVVTLTMLHFSFFVCDTGNATPYLLRCNHQ